MPSDLRRIAETVPFNEGVDASAQMAQAQSLGYPWSDGAMQRLSEFLEDGAVCTSARTVEPVGVVHGVLGAIRSRIMAFTLDNGSNALSGLPRIKAERTQLLQTLVDAYLRKQEAFGGLAGDGIVTIYHGGLDRPLVPNWDHVLALRESGRLLVRETKRGQWDIRIPAEVLEQVAGEGQAVSEQAPQDPAEVWVIHGQDEGFRRAIFDLLRQVKLHPVEFNAAVLRSGSASPYVLDVVLSEIRKAPAIVSLLTPDDHAELREDLRKEPKDLPEHRQAGYQPRPNVILETGMALALTRDRTVVVTKGRLREISDVAGLHAVQWDDTSAKRKDLVQRLQKLGLPVDMTGNDWLG